MSSSVKWLKVHELLSLTARLLANGDQAEMEVVRVGTYNLVADGMYLEYSPENGLVSELARQPSGHQGSAEDLQEADAGFTKVGLDPTGPLGGGLLRALINTPTLVERWHFGGIVGYVITAVFAVAHYAGFLALYCAERHVQQGIFTAQDWLG